MQQQTSTPLADMYRKRGRPDNAREVDSFEQFVQLCTDAECAVDAAPIQHEGDGVFALALGSKLFFANPDLACN